MHFCMLSQNVAAESTKACLDSRWSGWDSKVARPDINPDRYHHRINIKFHLNVLNGLRGEMYRAVILKRCAARGG
jgi:hypothetical protein